MRIIHANGSIEDKPDNYRHQWSPADILAIDIPPENRPTVGNPHHKIKRQSAAELKAGDQKKNGDRSAGKGRQTQSKIGTLKLCTTSYPNSTTAT